MRRLAFGLVLVTVWVLLWEGFTWGQVAAGVVVAAGLLLFLPNPTPSPGAGRLTFRPLPALRLLVWFTWQFLLSNFSVARAVLLPGRWVSTGVVHVELRSTSPTLAALVSNLTALTPGMQPVDGRPDGSALDIHVLSLRDDDTVRRVVQRLEGLVLAAFDPSATSHVQDPDHPGAPPEGPVRSP
jgi:multisubunit Na+/H+ antiporter MnhE subunit